jgi:hypothetical protein
MKCSDDSNREKNAFERVLRTESHGTSIRGWGQEKRSIKDTEK